MSGMTVVTPSAGLNRAKMYRPGRSTSPSAYPISPCSRSIWAWNMPCVKTTPLGMPVLPEVKATAASSSIVVGAMGNGSLCSERSASRVAPPQNQRLPAVMGRLTVRKASRKSRRRTWAIGMPMKLTGWVSNTHCMNALRSRRSRPGSTNTGTAPILSRAKVTAINSTPGRIMTSVRSPWRMPCADRPYA